MTKTNAITPAEAGITIKIISGPRGGVDVEQTQPFKAGNEHKWPHIAYTFELWRKDRLLYTGPYKLGVGHVKPARLKKTFGMRMTREQESMLNSWVSKPHADFINKELQADVAAIIANEQKVAPKLDDVMHSLLMDGAAFFDGETFEDWCANYGYDTDSRKAEETWRECDRIGRELNRALGRELINGLREWVSNQ